MHLEKQFILKTKKRNLTVSFFYAIFSSSSSDSLTIEALTTLSPTDFIFVRITHCVTLDVFLIHFNDILIVCHAFEIKITSEIFLSSSESILAEINFPVLLVTAIAFTHAHHLFWFLYSSIPVNFHIPFSVTIKTNSLSSHTIATSITSSFDFKLIPFTHAAALHIGRTSVSSN
jgi:hypothetical protein